MGKLGKVRALMKYIARVRVTFEFSAAVSGETKLEAAEKMADLCDAMVAPLDAEPVFENVEYSHVSFDEVKGEA